MQLNQGRAQDGAQVLDTDVWRETVTSQFVSGERSTPYAEPQFPFDDDTSTYGLAWYQGRYRGRCPTKKLPNCTSCRKCLTGVSKKS